MNGRKDTSNEEKTSEYKEGIYKINNYSDTGKNASNSKSIIKSNNPSKRFIPNNNEKGISRFWEKSEENETDSINQAEPKR